MILVTGATGTNGVEIVKLLSRSGVRCRALVRNPEKISTLSDLSQGSKSFKATCPARKVSRQFSTESIEPSYIHPSLLTWRNCKEISFERLKKLGSATS